MNFSFNAVDVVDPSTGNPITVKLEQLILNEVNCGPIFEIPTKWPCPETARGRIFCGNCKNNNELNEEQIKLLEDPDKHGYCKLGKIIIFQDNSPCQYHSKLSEDPTDVYGNVATPLDFHFEYDEKMKIKELRSDLTDIGNAHKFVKRHSKYVKYCYVWDKWMVWDEHRWNIDPTAEVERRAKETIYSLYLEAADPDITPKRRAHLVDWAQKSEKSSSIRSLLDIARSEMQIIVTQEQLDNNKYLFNANNLTIDLNNVFAREQLRKDYITKIGRVDYIPEAKCPRWIEFINLIFDNDQETIKFVQKACGYSLSGDIGEQCLFILWGAGENGKSTLLDTLCYILGDYAQNCQPETFMVREYSNGANNDLARLKGARFVTSVETEDGKKLAESLIKQATGGDKITARFLHKEFFEFIPEFKLWFCTQHRPVITGTDRGIWRRIRLIPFNVNVPNRLKELGRERVKNYHEVLIKEEGPGILNWMLEGYKLWQKEGLQMSESIANAVNDYKTEMDSIGRFIEEICDNDSGARILYKVLYEKYIIWCNNYNETPLGNRKFSSRMMEKGYTKSAGTGNQKYWIGLKVNESKFKNFQVTELPKVIEPQTYSIHTRSETGKPAADVTFGNSVTNHENLKLYDGLSTKNEIKENEKPQLILENSIKDIINFLNLPVNQGANIKDLTAYAINMGIKQETLESKLKLMLQIGELTIINDIYEVT